MGKAIHSVLVIGSGPIIIGQAAEFDYAGTQACKALKEEGVLTILVNSNPATIMTDDEIADAVYIEPLTAEVLERIIAKEQPDGILPTLGGQTGLNLAVELNEKGILAKYNVEMLGTPLTAIKQAEDRELFRQLLNQINEPEPPNATLSELSEANDIAKQIGFPLVVRPAYTLGGTGGGVVRKPSELIPSVESGLAASPIHQVLLERYLEGWKEIEVEVIRDSSDTCIMICNMENFDSMGVHTGDSIVVAPSQTLSDKEYQVLRSASLKIIRALGIEGGCNVQFALAPHPIISETLPVTLKPDSNLQYYVIEVNPRVSRSSALASKATGYPIARVAAKIAIGKCLDEIPNAVTQETMASFEPALDYCVVKIPRWPFDKFPTGDRTTGTQMKATGEVMAIDRTYEAAFQKAVRSLEVGGFSLLWEDPDWIKSEKNLTAPLFPPTDLRIWGIMSALRHGITIENISRLSLVDPWFINAMDRIVKMEKELISAKEITPTLLWNAKRLGFSDSYLSSLGIGDGIPENVRHLRKSLGIRPVYKMVDTCAAEFEAATPYYYSTYEQENEAFPLPGPKAMVLGSGPIRIGQGIEFDYCSVHAAWALQKENIKSVLINSNPETVSTDFDTTDRLYFEPLDEESVRDIIENETIHDNGNLNPSVPSTVVQFGGQTAINLSQILEEASLPILGSSAQAIDIASDRGRFEKLMSSLGIPQPPGTTVTNVPDALEVAQRIGYPVLVRPSYVLGGRAMEIVQEPSELAKYINRGLQASPGHPILVDKYLEGKECEVDAICDGETVLIPGVMEHVERAGVHSGDSLAIYPGLNLTSAEVETLVNHTTKIALGLGIKGLLNVQFVIMGGSTYRSPETSNQSASSMVYVLEVNPRASRTVPFLSKVTNVPIVRLATQVMVGKTLKDLGYTNGLYPRQHVIAIKAPVFSMSKLTGVDSYLGPEMKSTGEVMGIDHNYQSALSKALISAGMVLPKSGKVLLSIASRDKEKAIPLIKRLNELEYSLIATEGTAEFIRNSGIDNCEVVSKLGQGNPNVVDLLQSRSVGAVINTMTNSAGIMKDGFQIRRAAVEQRIPCFTSIDTARAALEAVQNGDIDYKILRRSEYLI